MSIVIRPVHASDEAAWSTLFAEYRAFYQEPEDAALVAKAWRMLGDPHDESQGLVAVDDDVVIGLANWREFPDPLSTERGIFLDDLYVAPDARGRGAGERLIEALADLARERGFSVVRWITDPANSTARRLYDRVATATPWVTYDLNP